MSCQCKCIGQDFNDEEFQFDQQEAQWPEQDEDNAQSDDERQHFTDSDSDNSVEDQEPSDDEEPIDSDDQTSSDGEAEDHHEDIDEDDFVNIDIRSQFPQPNMDTTCSQPGNKPLRMTYVNMPTGKRFAVVVPIQRGHECDGKVRLITMRYDGKLGEREYTIVMKETEKMIRSKSSNGYKIIKIQKVVNCCLWKQFREREREIFKDAGFVNEQMLFHGSSRVNKIVKWGFDCHNVTVGNLGHGYYFTKISSEANKDVFGNQPHSGCKKHNKENCRHCPRKMLLCRVALGKEYEVSDPQPTWTYAPSDHHSLTGVPSKGGMRYKKHAVYIEDQAYPEFVITYKIT